MSFSSEVTPSSIVGNATMGVQSSFPKRTFDVLSQPSLVQVTEYARSALGRVGRLLQRKGYVPANVTNSADIAYLVEIAETMTAVEIHSVVDQEKDGTVATTRAVRLEGLLKEWETSSRPLPNYTSELVPGDVGPFYPQKIVRR